MTPFIGDDGSGSMVVGVIISSMMVQNPIFIGLATMWCDIHSYYYTTISLSRLYSLGGTTLLYYYATILV